MTTIARCVAWTAVAVVSAASVACMAICLAVMLVALLWTAGVLVPIAAVTSILRGRR